jgi:hypothetical protein
MLLSLSLMMVGPSGLEALFGLISGMMDWEQPPPAVGAIMMPNVRGSAYRAFLLCRQWLGVTVPSLPFQIMAVAASLAVLYLLWTVWRRRRAATAPLLGVQFSATILIMTLVIPHYHFYDLTVLVLPAFILGLHFARTGYHARYQKMLRLTHLGISALWVIFPQPAAAQLVALLLLYVTLILQGEMKRTLA